MRNRFPAVLFIGILALAFLACGEGPTDSTPVPTPKPRPLAAVDTFGSGSFELVALEPSFRSTLKLGDTITIRGRYTLSDRTLWSGFGYMREDGRSYINTIGSGIPEYISPPYEKGSSTTLSPLNGLYDFAKGHTVDVVFVVGKTCMSGGDDRLFTDWTIHWECVVFWAKIHTQYYVPYQ